MNPNPPPDVVGYRTIARQTTSSEHTPLRLGHPSDAVGTHGQALRLGKKRRRNPHPRRKARQPTSSAWTPRRKGWATDVVGTHTSALGRPFRRRWRGGPKRKGQRGDAVGTGTLPLRSPSRRTRQIPHAASVQRQNPCSTSRSSIAGKFFPSFSTVVPNYFDRHNSPFRQFRRAGFIGFHSRRLPRGLADSATRGLMMKSRWDKKPTCDPGAP